MGKIKNTSSKNTNKNNVSNGTTDYKYSPKVETPNPKAATNKTTDCGCK